MQNESATQASFLVHNGILCDATTAARPAMTDGALIRGQGAFETLAAYGGNHSWSTPISTDCATRRKFWT